MTTALVANIARPISSALSTAFNADNVGLLANYGLLGVSNPDAVIEALFANSEQGAWYDQSDLSTMFQDRTGTTPVTADGQPVGLILDKSFGASDEFPNGDFSAPLTGWAASTANISGAIVGGVLEVTNNGAGWFYYVVPNLVIGRRYTLFFNWLQKNGGGRIYLDESTVGGYDLGYASNSGAQSISFVATTTNLYLSISDIAGGTGVVQKIDNIKLIAGNHAVAPSDAARPMKTSTGISKWINYDAVDDVLNSTFPSSLGSSCTVGRANVGSAATILTAQTIGTSYADSTDNAGLIIVNRALTTQETSDLTAWLTAKGATA